MKKIIIYFMISSIYLFNLFSPINCLIKSNEIRIEAKKISDQKKLFDYLNDLLSEIDEFVSLINNDEKENIEKQIQKIKDKISKPNFADQDTKELAQKLLRHFLGLLSFQATLQEKILAGKEWSIFDEECFQDKLEKIIGIENAKNIKNLTDNLEDKIDQKFIEIYGIQTIEYLIDIIIQDTQISDEIKNKIIHLSKEHIINSETPFDDNEWDLFSKICLFIRDNILPLSDDELLSFFNKNDRSENTKELRLELLTKFNDMLNEFELKPIFGEK